MEEEYKTDLCCFYQKYLLLSWKIPLELQSQSYNNFCCLSYRQCYHWKNTQSKLKFKSFCEFCLLYRRLYPSKQCFHFNNSHIKRAKNNKRSSNSRSSFLQLLDRSFYFRFHILHAQLHNPFNYHESSHGSSIFLGNFGKFMVHDNLRLHFHFNFH